jgi:hypothetical protein
MPFPLHDVLLVADTAQIDDLEEAIESNRSRAKPHGKQEDDSSYDKQEVMRKKKGELKSQDDLLHEKGKKRRSHFI